MKFLVPLGGEIESSFGILTSPDHGGIVDGIKNGRLWAADNNAFTKGFNPSTYFPWLKSMEPYRDTCLFVVVPDVVGNPIATMDNWRHWVMHFYGWPLAFAAQDGQEHLQMPNNFDTLFIGGSTEWKESQGAIDCIRLAQQMRKHIHIGRVNWKRRYDMFNVLDGSVMFTCDGTRTRFDGKDKTLNAWHGYMRQRPLIQI